MERGKIMKIDLNFIPKKYKERVSSIEIEDGLIDDFKYMLYLNEGWEFFEEGMQSIPVRSKKEALYFIKNETFKTKENQE